MKRFLFACIISLFPSFALAQDENPVTDDFYDDMKDLTSVVHFDDHMSVMQVNTSNDSFDLIALNDNMQVLWRTTIAGYGIKVGKFKNKIAAVAAAEHSTMKGNGNTYKGFIIDPATGKTLVEKVIYDDNKDYIEQAKVLIGDNYFKIVVRQTNVTRSIHVGIPIFVIFQLNSWTKEMNSTQKMNIIDLDDKLQPVSTVNPVVLGTFITAICNERGDVFVSWLNGSDIEVYKYDVNKTAPSAQLTADVAIKPNDSMYLGDMILFATSKTNPGDLYYSLMYRNEDKDMEVLLGKMDFAANKKNGITQVIKKADLKAVEKSFVVINKKMNDPDLGTPRELELRSLVKTDDNVILTFSGEVTYTSNYGSYTLGKSLLLNVYDNDLKPKFQQVFPPHFVNEGSESGLHAVKNKLYVVSNDKDGRENKGSYGVLDLNTGQWDRMYYLTRKSIKGYLDGADVLWYGNGFIAPYLKIHGMFTEKYNLSIQANQY